MANKKILLVEGVDDLHVLANLCKERNLPKAFEIKDLNGVENLLKKISADLKTFDDSDIVGIVIDADTDIASRWDALKNILTRLKYQNVPEKPLPDGTIVLAPEKSLLPKVGIWIMPDNQTSGILEDFLRFLVPAGSPLLAHAEASVKAISKDERKFSDLDCPKALIHTWLAWQEEPGRPLGTAITARYLDSDVAQVDVLIAWLNRLYSL